MKVSVVMCTYNGASYVEEQIKSIVHQTRRVDEIIVSDDNSDDETLEIVKPILLASRIDYKIIKNIPGKGVSENFFSAMKQATGDYVFTADQDDIWKEEKVEIFLNRIEKTKKLLYFSDGELVDANAELLGVSLWSTLNIDYQMMVTHKIEDILLNRCVVTGSAMAVSKRLIDMVSYIPESWLHDGWFSIIAAYNHSIEPINSCTYYYRQHGNNVVGAKKLTLSGRINSWVRNISKQTQLRKQRYNRYSAVKELIGDDENEMVENCVNFWEALTRITSSNKQTAIAIIVKNFVNGNYGKYYTGIRGATRDIISLFVE